MTVDSLVPDIKKIIKIKNFYITILSVDANYDCMINIITQNPQVTTRR